MSLVSSFDDMPETVLKRKIEYYTKTEKGLNVFRSASENLPTKEIDIIINMMNEIDPFGNKPSKEDIRDQIVLNRLINRICHCCYSKKKLMNMKRCSKCCLVYYCNEICQKQDWSEHKIWCCNPEAELDKDIFLSVIQRL